MVPACLSKREKHIFTMMIVFIVMALLYNFIFEPGLEKWRLLDNEITSKMAKINRGIRLIKKREPIIQEYDTYARSSKNISKVLSDVESQAYSLGIKTSNIKPGQGIDRGLYREYAIELQIEGEMGDIIRFLSGLVELPTLVAVDKFDFKLISQSPCVFKGTVILSKIII